MTRSSAAESAQAEEAKTHPSEKNQIPRKPSPRGGLKLRRMDVAELE